jgi:N-carbamoyl-L-amino-acid hydrolase
MSMSIGAYAVEDFALNSYIYKRPAHNVSGCNKAIVLAGHLDTVPNGGRLDGTLGVLAGVEVLRTLHENSTAHDTVHRHPIIVAAYRCEESARFGRAFIGSSLAAGKPVPTNLGVPLPENMLHDPFGASRVAQRLDPTNFAAMLELHIEQGPVLERNQCQIGIVTSIVKATRMKIVAHGTAAHSGTTPMSMRHDALVAAAEIIHGADEIASTMHYNGDEIVATIGKIEVEPNATNVVPGKATLYLDVRSPDSKTKAEFIGKLMRLSEALLRQRGCTVTSDTLEDGDAVTMSRSVITAIRATAYRSKITFQEIVSGAGHDCMNFAEHCPVGMIFVPSKAGVSHHFSEHTDDEDVVCGAQVLLDTVLELDRSLS